jgi:Hypoxia induced protein conserved region
MGIENGDRTLMEYVLYHLVTLAVLAVFVVLALGLWNLTRGKSPNLSQKLMRWRVGLQFVAIVIIMLFVFVHNL